MCEFVFLNICYIFFVWFVKLAYDFKNLVFSKCAVEVGIDIWQSCSQLCVIKKKFLNLKFVDS